MDSIFEYWELADGLPPVLNQQAEETNRAYRAFWDYCNLGPDRSLRRLRQWYIEQNRVETTGDGGEDGGGYVFPTPTQNTIEDWSAKFRWQDRLKTLAPLVTAKEVSYWVSQEAIRRRRAWRLSEDLFALATDGLRKLSQKIEKGNEELKLWEIMQALRMASDLAERATGAAYEHVLKLQGTQEELFDIEEWQRQRRQAMAEMQNFEDSFPPFDALNPPEE